MKHVHDFHGWKQSISLLLIFCLLGSLLGPVPARANDIQEMWCTVFDDLFDRPEDAVVFLPMAESDDSFSMLSKTTTVVTIPAGEVRSALPGTCLRMITMRCEEYYYPCAIIKPALPPAYQAVMDESGVNYLMVVNRSDRVITDLSASGSTVRGDGVDMPYSVYLMTFDPNEDFKMRATVYSFRNRLQGVMYSYLPQEVWGVQMVGTDLNDSGFFPVATLGGHETKQSYLYSDSGFCMVSLDWAELPEYVLDDLILESEQSEAGSIWNFFPVWRAEQSEAGIVPDAFRSFLEGRQYLWSGQPFYNEEYQTFTCWDLDGDGLMELLMYNGGEDEQSAVHVYSAPQGSVQYVGTIACEWPDEYMNCFAGSTGVSVYRYDQLTDEQSGWMYRLENNALAFQQMNDSMIWSGTNLHWYTQTQMEKLSWDVFRKAPFRLSILTADFWSESDRYEKDEPFTVTVDVQNGTPPYTVRYFLGCLDEQTWNYRSLLDEEYRTEGGMSQFQLKPSTVDEQLELSVEVLDLYETHSPVWEVTLKPAWNTKRFYAKMSGIMEKAKDLSQTEGYGYMHGLGENAGWFARFLELLSGISDPVKALKDAVDTATGADKEKFLQKAAVTMCATEETLQLPSYDELPEELKDIKKMMSLSEDQYLNLCTQWVMDQAGLFSAMRGEELAQARAGMLEIFRQYYSGKIADLGYVLNANGYYGIQEQRLMTRFKALKNFEKIRSFFRLSLKTTEKISKYYNSVKDVFNQMSIAQTLDARQLSYIGGIYSLYFREFTLGEDLQNLAIATDMERAEMLFESNALLLGSDAVASVLDLKLAAVDLKKGGALALLDSVLWGMDYTLGVQSLSKEIYKLSMAAELADIFWNDFQNKRKVFLASPGRSTLDDACYALINYEMAAAEMDKTYEKVVGAGLKSLLLDLIGYNEGMEVSKERARLEAEYLTAHANMLREVLNTWERAGTPLPEEFDEMMDALESLVDESLLYHGGEDNLSPGGDAW